MRLRQPSGPLRGLCLNSHKPADSCHDLLKLLDAGKQLASTRIHQSASAVPRLASAAHLFRQLWRLVQVG